MLSEFIHGMPLNQQTLIVGIDTCFLFVAWRGAMSIRSLPKTYLSEIIFPIKMCVRGLASLIIALNCLFTFWMDVWFERDISVMLLYEAIVWTLSSWLVWMEHRRNLITSYILRCFWVIRWAIATRIIVSIQKEDALERVLQCINYCCLLCMAFSCLWAQRHLTSMSPEVIALSTQRVKSTIQDKSEATRDSIAIVKDEVKVSIPSYTITRTTRSTFVSYKIFIQTEDEAWSVRRRFTDFIRLRKELPDFVQFSDIFPHESSLKQFNQKQIDNRREKLELFLQNVLAHSQFDLGLCSAMCEFFDMEYAPRETSDIL
ncbi:hypothetical protein THRCLA_09748 [Thraustotheca clavata]|uniref:PX domain-containing protein n=1 Tax=Thraustotheca clavata TaxID=74557 RepID=A0A1V9YUL4_9STRA|nr:hypothetical protein THRCLA_09748 [Thraustotheca clavata]